MYRSVQVANAKKVAGSHRQSESNMAAIPEEVPGDHKKCKSSKVTKTEIVVRTKRLQSKKTVKAEQAVRSISIVQDQDLLVLLSLSSSKGYTRDRGLSMCSPMKVCLQLLNRLQW
jgi:hypothetical protein